MQPKQERPTLTLTPTPTNTSTTTSTQQIPTKTEQNQYQQNYQLLCVKDGCKIYALRNEEYGCRFLQGQRQRQRQRQRQEQEQGTQYGQQTTPKAKPDIMTKNTNNPKLPPLILKFELTISKTQTKIYKTQIPTLQNLGLIEHYCDNISDIRQLLKNPLNFHLNFHTQQLTIIQHSKFRSTKLIKLATIRLHLTHTIQKQITQKLINQILEMCQSKGALCSNNVKEMFEKVVICFGELVEINRGIRAALERRDQEVGELRREIGEIRSMLACMSNSNVNGNSNSNGNSICVTTNNIIKHNTQNSTQLLQKLKQLIKQQIQQKLQQKFQKIKKQSQETLGKIGSLPEQIGTKLESIQEQPVPDPVAIQKYQSFANTTVTHQKQQKRQQQQVNIAINKQPEQYYQTKYQQNYKQVHQQITIPPIQSKDLSYPSTMHNKPKEPIIDFVKVFQDSKKNKETKVQNDQLVQVQNTGFYDKKKKHKKKRNY